MKSSSYKSCASIHKPRKQASVVINGSLIISVPLRDKTGGWIHAHNGNDNRLVSCNLERDSGTSDWIKERIEVRGSE